MEHITHTTQSGKTFEMPEMYDSVVSFYGTMRINRNIAKTNKKYAHHLEELEALLPIVKEYLEENNMMPTIGAVIEPKGEQA